MDKTKNLILVKLGGSLITDKKTPFKARPSVIKRLGKEIKLGMMRKSADLIIAHGSGSFGHTYASQYQTHSGLINKKSIEGLVLTADVASEISRITVKNLILSKLNAVSFSPASFIVSKEGLVKEIFLEQIKRAIDLNIIPIVYGDTIFDLGERGFGIFSGEKIINIMVKSLKEEYKNITIIFCGDTNGVLDKNGYTVEKIDEIKFNKMLSEIKGSEGRDVTGGMHHKVKQSLKIAKEFKIKTMIINGKKTNNLKHALQGKKITATIIE